MEEYKIGNQFYCQVYSGYNNNESISLVTLESIKQNKVRGKDEYYNTYGFKHSDGSIESQFIENLSKTNTSIFSKTKTIGQYHSLFYYIYKLDDEHILKRKKELEAKNEKYRGIKVLEEFISELKKSDSIESLPKLNAVVKVIKHYG